MKTKKLIYGGLFLALVGIGFIGCKKDNLTNVLHNQVSKSEEPVEIAEGISVENNLLIFSSVENYQNFIESDNKAERKNILDKLKEVGFKNYFSVNTNKNKGSNMDAFFGQLLNNRGLMKIGYYLYQIDVANNSVYSIKCKDSKNTNKSINLILSKNSKVMKFSTSDNVLALTQNEGIEKCSEDGVGSRSSSVYSNGIKTTLRHSKYGIYFDLVVEVQALQQAGPMFTFRVEFNSHSTKRRFKRRCKSWQYTSMVHQSMPGVNNYKYKINESAFRNYSKYDLKCRTKTYPYNIITGEDGNLISLSPWVEIRVNC